MPRVLAVLAVAGAVLLGAGVAWAVADRAAATSAGATAALATGTVACLAAVAGTVVVERRPGGLTVPEGVRLPVPDWRTPVALVGAGALAGGLLASVPMAVVGVLLLAAALVGWGRSLQASAPDPPVDRRVVAAARNLHRFAERHPRTTAAGDGGGPDEGGCGDPVRGADAVLTNVARGAVRVVVVAADGAFGDAVLPDPVRARLAAEMSGATVHDAWPDDLTPRVRTGPGRWVGMGGRRGTSGQPARD